MGRPLRIDHPGAYHHVTNRGRNKQDVFGDDEDRELFIDYLRTTITLGLVELHAFALMGNHYHLLLRTCTKNGLSRAMQIIGGGYTLDFNRRYGLDGSLFKGRFFSKLIDNERYLMEVPRYIANNPVKAGLVTRPEDYRWSSQAVLHNQPNAPCIPVSRDILIDYFRDNVPIFTRFVSQHDTKQAIEFERVIDSQLPDLSLQESLDRIDVAFAQFGSLNPRSPSVRPIVATLTDYVLGAMDMPLVALLLPSDDTTRVARGLLLALLHRCRVATLPELAAAFGFGTGQGVARSIKRFDRAAAREPALAAIANAGLALLGHAA